MTSFELLSFFGHDDIKSFSNLQLDQIDFREPIDVASDFLDPILKDGASALAVCIYEGAEQCLSWIFGNTDSSNLFDRKQRSLFHFAASSKNSNVYRMIENYCVDTDSQTPDYYGSLPIHYAASYGNLQILQYLWMNGSDLTVQNDLGFTPLHFAVQNQKLNIVSFLLNNSVPIDVQSHEVFLFSLII